MDTILLNIIRSEIINRKAPGIIAKRKNKHTKKKTILFWVKLIMSSIKQVTYDLNGLNSINFNKLILVSNSHKYIEVENELEQAGLNASVISKPGSKHVSLLDKLLTLWIVICNTMCLIKIFRTRHAKEYYKDIFSYSCFVYWMAKRLKKKYYWVMIGDLSSKLISLSAACHKQHQTLVYWQYSFLDFKPLPVSADISIVLNEKGFRLSKYKTDSCFYWRNINTTETLKTKVISNEPLGIVLNSHADRKSIDLIIRIQKITQKYINIRPHPTSKLEIPYLSEKIKVSKPNETLESFSQKISLAICGNTQAQLKLIMLGVPVLQMANLDTLDYDLHHYIKDGIVPGIRKPEDFNVEAIISFYKSGEYLTPLYNHIGPQGDRRKPDLYDFVKTIH